MDPHHETWDLWIKKDKSNREFFEVAAGTILVQNTNWVNVNKAIKNLKDNEIFSFKKIIECDEEKLEEVIRPAGFFKQKSRYLKALSRYLENNTRNEVPSRQTLLKIEGVGNETADSILAYCYGQSTPIVGTYTRRFFARFFLEKEFMTMKCDLIQKFMKSNLGGKFEEYGRFHALIVCHAQNICQKKNPQCQVCCLREMCKFSLESSNQEEKMEIQNKIAKSYKKKKQKTT